VRRIALVLALIPGALWSAEWQELRSADIRLALEGRKVSYASGAWQDFRASGRTLYKAGQDSWGYWRVQGDQYCSMWPPSDLWACYDLERNGDALRFVGQAGDVTEARYAD